MNEISSSFDSMRTHPGRIASKIPLVAAFLLCVTAVYYLFGWQGLDPTNLAWLTGDRAQHYLGWAFLRDTPQWSFPPTWTDRLGHPWGLSASYLDIIPPVALLLRPFGSMLPDPFQYLGLYSALCVLLQFFFGYKLARQAGLNTPSTAAAGGLFFAFAPPMIYRFFGHTAYASHWLLLAALYLYIRTPWQSTLLARLGPLWITVALAGAVTPYLGVMCLMICLAACAREWLRKMTEMPGLIGLGLVSCLVLATVLVLFGWIVPGDAGQYAGIGYRYYSLNLLSPFDPQRMGGLLYGPLPQATTGQSEGYNYLGLGVMAMLALGLVRSRFRIQKLADPSVLPLAAVGLICTLLAVSATVTIGPYVLLKIPLPNVIEQLLASFRASGRFFWPVAYLLFFLGLKAVAGLRTPYRTLLLASLLVLQLLDVLPLAGHVRNDIAFPKRAPLTSDIWDTLSQGHDHLMVVPPWQCGTDLTPGGLEGSQIFGFLASNQNMTLNSYYAGRTGPVAVKRHCREAIDPIQSGMLAPRTAYVVNDEILMDVYRSNQDTHRCVQVDGFNLCLEDATHPGVVFSSTYPPSEWTGVSEKTLPGVHRLQGWTFSKELGWTCGAQATLLFNLRNTTIHQLELEARVLRPKGYAGPVTVTIGINGQTAGSIHYGEQGTSVKRLAIPERLAAQHGLTTVSLTMEPTLREHHLSTAGALGMAIDRLRLVSEQSGAMPLDDRKLLLFLIPQIATSGPRTP